MWLIFSQLSQAQGFGTLGQFVVVCVCARVKKEKKVFFPHDETSTVIN